MATVICIAGESGSGKTTSLRNLNPQETYIIDSDKKGLSWKGWKKQYNQENKNYFTSCTAKDGKTQEIIQLESDDASSVMFAMKKVNSRPEIKTLVIDTIGTIMVADEMRRCKEKGYDKWIDLAQCIWDMVSYSHTMRDDLTIIFIAHTQTEVDDDGYKFTRIKTNGKKLNKISLETKFSTVLISKCIDNKYVFEVHAKNSVAKSPMELFDSDIIPNDINEVIHALKKYESEEE